MSRKLVNKDDENKPKGSIVIDDPESWTEEDYKYLLARPNLKHFIPANFNPNPPVTPAPDFPSQKVEDTPGIVEYEVPTITDMGDLESMTKAELVELAEARGVSSAGTKADILHRLTSNG